MRFDYDLSLDDYKIVWEHKIMKIIMGLDMSQPKLYERIYKREESINKNSNLFLAELVKRRSHKPEVQISDDYFYSIVNLQGVKAWQPHFVSERLGVSISAKRPSFTEGNRVRPCSAKASKLKTFFYRRQTCKTLLRQGIKTKDHLLQKAIV
ncbi:hypothetical protein LguiA_031101 [Lonicera macranthoides]